MGNEAKHHGVIRSHTRKHHKCNIMVELIILSILYPIDLYQLHVPTTLVFCGKSYEHWTYI